MLSEIALWLGTPVSLAHRRAGHLARSIALWSRSRRRQSAWAAHLASCRAFVEPIVEALPRHRAVVVLGSGLVEDVPAQRLLAAFDVVILVDAVHLWPVRLRFARHARVRFVELDLLVPGALAQLQARDDVDLVISANILSQLAMPLTGGAERPDIAGPIVRRHLADLVAFRGRKCLLTDVAWEEVDAAGSITERADLLGGVELPAPDRTWNWLISPRGEEDARLAYRHIVQAYGDWRSQA